MTRSTKSTIFLGLLACVIAAFVSGYVGYRIGKEQPPASMGKLYECVEEPICGTAIAPWRSNSSLEDVFGPDRDRSVLNAARARAADIRSDLDMREKDFRFVVESVQVLHEGAYSWNGNSWVDKGPNFAGSVAKLTLEYLGYRWNGSRYVPPDSTPQGLNDRTSCAAIRGTDYRSESERVWFQTNCQSLPPVATVTPSPNPAAYLGSSNPPSDFCSFAPCIANFWNGRGYVVQCLDGLYSKSGGIQGSCSQHGGNR
jgi:hypothetical protein